jgi:hypothetical protein
VVPYAAAYEFIEGRLRFGGARYKYKARFDNMVAIFMPTVIQQEKVGFSGPAIEQRNKGGKGGPEHVDDYEHHRRT